MSVKPIAAISDGVKGIVYLFTAMILFLFEQRMIQQASGQRQPSCRGRLAESHGQGRRQDHALPVPVCGLFRATLRQGAQTPRASFPRVGGRGVRTEPCPGPGIIALQVESNILLRALSGTAWSPLTLVVFMFTDLRRCPPCEPGRYRKLLGRQGLDHRKQPSPNCAGRELTRAARFSVPAATAVFIRGHGVRFIIRKCQSAQSVSPSNPGFRPVQAASPFGSSSQSAMPR